MNASLISVETYLTVQIQEIVGYGALHALIWAPGANPSNWLQLSVHCGAGCHLMVQCRLPEGVDKRCVDTAFGEVGWITMQADEKDCLIYYPARSDSYDELQERAVETARRCAEAMFMLWGVTALDELALLGARGPRLSLHRVAADADSPAAHAIAA